MPQPMFKIVAGGTEKNLSTGGPATAKIEVKTRGHKQAKKKAAELTITHCCATVYDERDNYLYEIVNMNWGNPGSPPEKSD